MRWFRRIVVLLATLSLASSLAPGVAGAAAGWTVDRTSGSDRYATAAALANRAFPNGAPEVVVASGERFPDALAASPIAAKRHAPLLLTLRDEVPSDTLDALGRLGPRRIWLVGGTAAVAPAVEQELARHWPVTRVAGTDRYDTAVRLTSGTFGANVPVAFLVSGEVFPDALSAGAAAGRLGGPVLLVTPNHVPSAVQGELDRLAPTRLYVVGGPAVVSDQVMAELAGRPVERIAGPDRYSTAAALLDLVPPSGATAVVATGADYPDGLAAGPAAAALGGSFALAGPGCFLAKAADHLFEDGVRDLVAVGGPRALPDAALTPCMSGVVPGLSDGEEVPGDAPDPTILASGGRWYAYSTESNGVRLPVRSSSDLTDWSETTEAMPVLASWIRPGHNWAPSVVEVGGAFVAWYSAQEDASGLECLSRAVSSSTPLGPFVDEGAEPALCQRSLGGSIDPDVFVDADGSKWLLWKSDENEMGQPSRLWIAQLSDDATSIVGSPTVVLSQTVSWENPTIEQPSIVRQGFTYYLFYSGGWWESSGYGMGYATATSLLGPYTKQTTRGPWVGTTTGAAGPGGLATFRGPDGALWAAYHAWTGSVGYASGGTRTMRVAPLRF
jgi:putative cell wall-binding protein